MRLKIKIYPKTITAHIDQDDWDEMSSDCREDLVWDELRSNIEWDWETED